MTTDAEIDAKLARLGRRMQTQRDDVRDELQRAGLLGSVTAAREAFGGKLVWFKSDRLEVGREIPAGFVPTPYTPRRLAAMAAESKKAKKTRKRNVPAPAPRVTWHDRYMD